MKIGILQCGLVPHELSNSFGEYPGMFAQLLDGHGFTFQSWAVVDNVLPDSPEDADGWLITGSRHAAYEPHPWIPPLEDLIRAIIAADRPLIGVCFGHQIIAQALGGRVVKFDGGWAVGPHTYRFASGDMKIHAWHQDQVVDRPDTAKVVASNAFCENAALLYGNQVYTVQPHPEIQDGYAQGLIDTRGPGIVPQDILQAAADKIGAPLQSKQMAAQFAHFFRERSLS